MLTTGIVSDVEASTVGLVFVVDEIMLLEAAGELGVESKVSSGGILEQAEIHSGPSVIQERRKVRSFIGSGPFQELLLTTAAPGNSSRHLMSLVGASPAPDIKI